MKFKIQVEERLQSIKDRLEVSKNGMEKKTITSEKVYETIEYSVKVLEEVLSFINRE